VADVALSRLGHGVTLLSFLRDAIDVGRLYYTVNLRYATPAREVEALNRGLAVSHEYSLLERPDQPLARAAVGDVIRVKVTVVSEAERENVVVEDFLPAGFEPIDPQLKITDPALIAQLQAERERLNRPPEADYCAPWFSWYRSPFDEVALRDDRLVLRSTVLPKGVHEYVYYVRASAPGDFYVAPARAEEAQFPEVFGRSDSGRFVIEP
jgi:hypothetical protein